MADERGPDLEVLDRNAALEGGRPVDYSAGPPGARPVYGRAGTRDRVPGIVIMGFSSGVAALFLALVVGFFILIMTAEEAIPAGFSLFISAVGIALMGVAVGVNVASIRFSDRHPEERGRPMGLWGFSLSLAGVVLFLLVAFFSMLTMFVI